MLEIVRGRNWSVAHSVYDDAELTVPTDLSQFESIACQIREKNATRNRKGFFEHRVVATVLVEVVDNVMWLKLPVSTVNTLHIGDYIIDAVGTLPDETHESLLDPEPVKTVNRPTAPAAIDAVMPPEVPIPDFSEEFEVALED